MKQLLVIFLFGLVSMSAYAGKGADRLQAFFSETRSVRADFTQDVLGSNSETLQQTSGQMLLDRPGRFRWDYKKPFEQQIVSNGEKVWLYDVDLEQVTIKTIDAAFGNSPALVLSSDKPLEESFIINDLGEENNHVWVELLPKDKESGFESIRLSFDEKNLTSMELRDVFGQLTKLSFSNIERNPNLGSASFDFIAPPGVDVIGE